MEQLAKADFRFALHGHIDKAETSLYPMISAQVDASLYNLCRNLWRTNKRAIYWLSLAIQFAKARTQQNHRLHSPPRGTQRSLETRCSMATRSRTKPVAVLRN
jgi:hypothetical protein